MKPLPCIRQIYFSLFIQVLKWWFHYNYFYLTEKKVEIKSFTNWLASHHILLFNHSVVSNSLQPMDGSTPDFPVLHHLLEIPKLMSAESVMPSNHSILCCSLLLPSFFPSIRIFSELALHIRWPRYFSVIFSISPSNEYSGLISFRMDWFDLAAQRTLKSLFNNTVQKHQFFDTQASLWSNSHIHTWLLEKLHLWLYRVLLAK